MQRTILCCMLLVCFSGQSFADSVPGAILELDARNNVKHSEKAWKNLGTTGGQINAQFGTAYLTSTEPILMPQVEVKMLFKERSL